MGLASNERNLKPAIARHYQIEHRASPVTTKSALKHGSGLSPRAVPFNSTTLNTVSVPKPRDMADWERMIHCETRRIRRYERQHGYAPRELQPKRSTGSKSQAVDHLYRSSADGPFTGSSGRFYPYGRVPCEPAPHIPSPSSFGPPPFGPKLYGPEPDSPPYGCTQDTLTRSRTTTARYQRSTPRYGISHGQSCKRRSKNDRCTTALPTLRHNHGEHNFDRCAYKHSAHSSLSPRRYC